MKGEGETSIVLDIRVVPRASRTEIVGLHDGALKVRLAAPPVDGAANEELTGLLAKRLRVPRSAITILSGVGSRTKKVRIQGAGDADLKRLLKAK
jgi:uncharacterized protein